MDTQERKLAQKSKNRAYILDDKFEEFESGSFVEEQTIHKQLIDASTQLMRNMRKKHPKNTMTRDAHAKSHGCLKAEFNIDNSALPENLRLGIFSSSKNYDAWVRYSNNDHQAMRKDKGFDLRGVAIKVMNVSGEKILPLKQEAMTQDFLMYGSPIFFIKNNADYIEFTKSLDRGNSVKTLFTKTPKAGFLTAKAQILNLKYKNPANMNLFSAVPVRLGKLSNEERSAFKYRVQRCDTSKKYPRVSGKRKHNYMRENLELALEEGEICLNFQVQLWINDKLTPVEDSTYLWKEAKLRNFSGNPYITVAKVIIPQQNFNTEERKNYCENLSFTPWHGLVDHKPLGRTMRMRRDLYLATSEFRRTENNAKQTEPEDYEIK